MPLGGGRSPAGNSSTTNEVAALGRLLTLVDDTITILDVDGRVRWVNHDATSGILGYAPGALVGRTPWEFIHPDDVAPLGSLWEQLLERPGVTLDAQARLLAADGSYQDVEGTAHNLIEVPGIEGVVLVTRNITRHVMAAEVSDSEIIDLLDQGCDMAILLSPALDATFVSDSTLRTLGLEADELRTVDEVVEMITPGDRRRFADSLEAAHATHETQSLMISFNSPAGVARLALRIQEQITRDGVGLAITGTDQTEARS